MLAKGHVNLYTEYVTLVQCYLQDWESTKNACNMCFNSVTHPMRYIALHKEAVCCCKLILMQYCAWTVMFTHVHAV
jgi:hypothetical protein